MKVYAEALLIERQKPWARQGGNANKLHDRISKSLDADMLPPFGQGSSRTEMLADHRDSKAQIFAAVPLIAEVKRAEFFARDVEPPFFVHQRKEKDSPLPPVAPVPTLPRPVRHFSTTPTAGCVSSSLLDFESIWNLYPKKDAKAFVRTAWFKLLRSGQLPPPDKIRTAIGADSEHDAEKRIIHVPVETFGATDFGSPAKGKGHNLQGAPDDQRPLIVVYGVHQSSHLLRCRQSGTVLFYMGMRAPRKSAAGSPSARPVAMA